MSAQNQDQRPQMERPPYRPSPMLVIFLIMPVMAGIVALIIGSNPFNLPEAGNPTPPAVAFTPFTLVGSEAPDFTLPTPEGESVQLSSLRGRWVLLNFWATWCGPCRAEMPLLQELIDGKLAGTSQLETEVTVLGVNLNETPETVRAFLDELDLSLPVVIDAKGQVNRLYSVVQLPVTYILDPQGIVRFKHIGMITPDLMEQYLERMANDQDG